MQIGYAAHVKQFHWERDSEVIFKVVLTCSLFFGIVTKVASAVGDRTVYIGPTQELSSNELPVEMRIFKSSDQRIGLGSNDLQLLPALMIDGGTLRLGEVGDFLGQAETISTSFLKLSNVAKIVTGGRNVSINALALEVNDAQIVAFDRQPTSDWQGRSGRAAGTVLLNVVELKELSGFRVNLNGEAGQVGGKGAPGPSGAPGVPGVPGLSLGWPLGCVIRPTLGGAGGRGGEGGPGGPGGAGGDGGYLILRGVLAKHRLEIDFISKGGESGKGGPGGIGGDGGKGGLGTTRCGEDKWVYGPTGDLGLPGPSGPDGPNGLDGSIRVEYQTIDQ
jgi:hypothetical protein